MAMPIHTIHVNSATKTSLNDRFTALSSQPKATMMPLPAITSRRRSRSRDSRPENRNENARVSNVISVANRRLIQQLAKKHKIMAALKLKRRSMKPGASMAFRRAANGMKLKRGSVKALRLAPGGNPIKANSLTKIATMKADLMNRMPTRRSNSISNLSGRLGAPHTGKNGGGGGGAAARVAKRRLARVEASRVQRSASVTRRRSRSRSSRTRLAAGTSNTTNIRNNNFVQNTQRTASRGRSRSRSRSRLGARLPPRNNNRKVPITARLGVKPGNVTKQARSSQTAGRGRQRGNLNRVAQGRIQKPNRQNTSNRVATASNSGRGGGILKRRLIKGGIENRKPLENTNSNHNNNRNRSLRRSNSVARGIGRRSRSRSRNNNKRAPSKQRKPQQQLQQQQQQTNQSGRGGGRIRGRSQQRGRRGRGGATGTQRNGNGQQQERRGRSRSRGRGRQLGKSSNKDVKREDLDKELDQYMATTKTETGMDFLLRN